METSTKETKKGEIVKEEIESIIQDLEGILYDFDKGYDVYESMKDLESAVVKLKRIRKGK